MVLVDMSTDTQEYGYQQTADKHRDSVDTDMDDYDSKLSLSTNTSKINLFIMFCTKKVIL